MPSIRFCRVALGFLLAVSRTVGAEPPVTTFHALREVAPPAVLESRANYPVSTPTRSGARPAAGTTQYSIGQPSDAEQVYLELLNRARANPTAEGIRLRDTTNTDIRNAYYNEGPNGQVIWSVNTNLFATQMAALPPAQPLAFNAKLIQAARGHTQFMFERVVRSHDQDGVSIGGRIDAVGYDWNTVAENVYSYAHNPEHGHAGFEVDWGEGPAGMQEPPGHRINNHNLDFTEIGIGVLDGTNTRLEGEEVLDVGPQLVTMNFGRPGTVVPLVTGVVYFDVNRNGFYDAGEGLGGLRVDVSGSDYFAITANSGGYTVPAAAGQRTVTFSGPGIAGESRNITLPDGQNVKVDLVLPYTAPVVTGSTTAFLGRDNAYSIAPVPAATGYRVRVVRLESATTLEGAEQGTNGVVADISAGYDLITTSLKAEGTHSFHLAHPGDDSNPPRDQVLTLKASFRAGSNPELKFASRLGWSTPDEVARAQISTDGGSTWVDVWTRPGTNSRGETAFVRRTIPLTGLAGREFRVRYVYSFDSGKYYEQTDTGFGFYVDEIGFTDVSVLTEVSNDTVPGTGNFVFRPAAVGNYGLGVQPMVGERLFYDGTLFVVSAVSAPDPAVVQLAKPVVGPNGKLRLDFTLVSGGAGTFVIERASALGAAWGPVAGATLTTNGPGSYTFRLDPSGTEGFLRVRVD